MASTNPAQTTFTSFISSNNKLTSLQQSGLSISISAPGKVILHGEHSVVYGKLAIAASLGLRTKLTLVECQSINNSTNSFKIELPDLNLVHFYNLSDIQNLLGKVLPLTKHSSNYNWEKPELIDHAELFHSIEDFIDQTAGSFPLSLHQKLSLCSFFYLFNGIIGAINVPVKPFAMKLQTDLTVSSGSGSSASFAVTIAAAVIQYIRIKALEGDLKDISKSGYKSAKLLNTDLNTFNDKELELISKWAFMAEKIIHGTPSGIDNTICTYGSVVEFRKTNGPKLIQLCQFQLLLVNTNVKRDTKRLVCQVAALKDRHPQIIDLILNAMEEISENSIECLKHLSKAYSEPELKQYYDKLAELTDMNQHFLQALGVSHPKLDQICAILKNGGLSGKLTGAGGGGYAFALVPSYFKNEKVQQLIEELNGRGFDAILTNLGGPGVTID